MRCGAYLIVRRKKGGTATWTGPRPNQMCLGTRIEMINVEALFFSLTRNLMLAVGLWPYQQPMFAQLQYILIFGFLATTIIFHVRLNIELVYIYIHIIAQ